ncbi:MAG TPA: hypothetical protein VF054_06675 [Micromonosporaceae bacterium]
MTNRPHDYPVVACSSCGAPIVWALTLKLHRTPVNADPDPTGDQVLVDMGEHRPPTVRKASHRDFGKRLYKSHFATCKYADRHRDAGKDRVSR